MRAPINPSKSRSSSQTPHSSILRISLGTSSKKLLNRIIIQPVGGKNAELITADIILVIAGPGKIYDNIKIDRLKVEILK